MIYYYRDTDGRYSVRSSPLVTNSETEVTEAEYNEYIRVNNELHNKEE